MKRMLFIKIHLYLSGVALVFMCLMALTGALHLLTGDESEVVERGESFIVEKDMSKDELMALFTEKLKEIDAGYRFDYIKGSNTSLVSRPTTRIYYTIKTSGGQATIAKHIPSWNKRFMEFHKGHGARSSRNFLGIFGLIVIGAVLSGIWLGLSSRALRRSTVFTVLSGAGFYFFLFYL